MKIKCRIDRVSGFFERRRWVPAQQERAIIPGASALRGV
jgi:hypothetical protein